MCTYCIQHGNGHEWYLNPENYTERARRMPHVAESGMIEIFGGNQKMDLEIGTAASLDMMIPDLADKENIGALNALAPLRHGGQIVTIEEVCKIIDLAEGDHLLYIPCYCRQYFGAVERLTCLWLYPVSKMVQRNRPWEPQKEVAKAEAKEQQQSFHEEGLVAGIYWTPLPIPMVICNCEFPYCMGLRARMHYGLTNVMRKGHSVARVDPTTCDGCSGAPRCIARCQFGALGFSPTDRKIMVNQMRCFGCGVCRPLCKKGALALIPRKDVPAVAGEY